MGRKAIDITGQRFGRLTAIKFIIKPKQKSLWLCRCDCGNYKEVSYSALVSGHTMSCGCLHSELLADRNKETSTHNLTCHPIYRRWSGMKSRCYNKKIKEYKNYGERGIIVCQEWLEKNHGFINFYNWAMSNGWENGLTLDRIDVDGNYCPENCRWVNNLTQQRNKRDTVFIECDGLRLCMSEWAEKLHIPKSTLANRREKGWSDEEIIRTPYKYDNLTSLVIGVRISNNKWSSSIMVKGISYWLGSYQNEEDAIIARLKKEKEIFGEHSPQVNLFSKYNI